MVGFLTYNATTDGNPGIPAGDAEATDVDEVKVTIEFLHVPGGVDKAIGVGVLGGWSIIVGMQGVWCHQGLFRHRDRPTRCDGPLTLVSGLKCDEIGRWVRWNQ
jgi:hypothetical protein